MQPEGAHSSLWTSTFEQADFIGWICNKACMIRFTARERSGQFKSAGHVNSGHIGSDKRGVVALWVAISTPAVGLALGLGVDVTEWVIANQQLQRAADAAANSGAIQYGITLNAQQAANAAADIAEANGATGGARASRTWNSATKTLVDNKITVVVGSPITAGDSASVAVTLSKSIAPTFSAVVSSANKVITATGTADATAGLPVVTYTQPCLVALGTASSSAVDITFSGSGSLAGTCSILSNEQISLSGGVQLNLGTAFANGTITIPNGTAINGVVKANTGTLQADPYAGNTTLSAAFLKLTNSTTLAAISVAGSSTTTIVPGIYPSMTVSNSGTVVMSPGLYVIKGAVNFSGASHTTGSGVTIVSSSTLTISGSAVTSLSAPSALTAIGGAVPGVLFATNINATSSAGVTFSGGVAPVLTGVVYNPTSQTSLSGGISTNGTAGCIEIISYTMSITGAASLSNVGCSALGVNWLGPANTTYGPGGTKLVM